MTNQTKNNTTRGIIFILIILCFSIGALAFQNYQDYSKLRNAFETEKKGLAKALDKVITDYDLIIEENEDLNEVLIEERNEMLVLKDSIESLEEENYSLFWHFRGKIKELSNFNKKLSKKVDSLNSENYSLKEKTKSVTIKLIDRQTEYNKLYINKSELEGNNLVLKQNNEKLERELTKAKQLKISNLTIIPMKKRNSGDYTTTSKYRKVSAFKVTLNLLKNEIANSGQRKIYLQIIDDDRKIISNKQKSIIVDGKHFFYSDVFTANYNNKDINLVTLVEFPKGTLKKGNYLINVFIEDRIVGNKLITLS